jgi:PAS domain S-box-containing protein
MLPTTLPPTTNGVRPARKPKLDLTAVLIRRRKAAVALLITLSIGVAALALVSFAKLMPVRGDAAHSVEVFGRARALEAAVTRANEAVANRDRTPKEAQAAWTAVTPFAHAVAEIVPDDDTEARAVKAFNDQLAESLKSIETGVDHLQRNEPALAGSARSYARIGLESIHTANRAVLDVAARQLDAHMSAARIWLGLCIGLVLLTGLMMAVTVLTWVYANYADRARARRLLPPGSPTEQDAEAEHRFNLLVERGPLAVVEWNTDYICTRWSGRAEEMFGRPASEVVGKRWDEIQPYLHPEDAQSVADQLAPLMRGDTDYVVIRHRNVKPDGTVIHCIWYNSALREGDAGTGSPRTFLSLANDVTRATEAEEAFREEAQLVRRIADVAPLGIAVSNLNGSVLFANDFIIELLGATREDMVGGKVTVNDWTIEELDGTPLPDHLRPTYIAAGTGKTVRAREVRARSRFKEEPTYLSITAVPLRDKHDHVDSILLLIEDITERTAAAAEREALAAELSHARRLETVGNLAGGIAHDFGNALLAISYSADLLNAATAAGRPTAEPGAQLKHAVDVARELTASLVNYASGRDGTRRPIDLTEFITAHCKFVARLLPPQFKCVCVPPATPGPITVNASVSQILQVLMNLAVNARDAMPDGGTVTISVGTDTSGPAPLAVLEVADTGHGMTPEVSRRAFDRYFTTKETDAGGGGSSGAGIGLATVRQIVHDHGGAIKVATAPGQGARFTITFPLIPPPQSVSPLTSTAPAVASASAQPDLSAAQAAAVTEAARAAATARAPIAVPAKLLKAMVVESDDRVRPLIVQSLRNSGYFVESFTTSAAGLEAFTASPASWAVVLMEVDTGGLDGATCLRRMRKAVPTLPAILITGDPADAGGQLVDEHTRVLFKPFTVGSLRSTLNDLFSPLSTR